MSSEGIDRKTFLREGYKVFLRAVSSAVERGVDIANEPTPLRPPGAVDEADFIARCNLCGKCWEACAHGAIQRLGQRSGAAGTPVIIPEQAPCLLCDPPVCSRVCPEEALVPVDFGQIRIGRARVNKAVCFAHQRIDRSCDYCYDRCPLKDRAITYDKGPIVLDEFCVGCGVCEYYCLSTPKSITILPPD